MYGRPGRAGSLLRAGLHRVHAVRSATRLLMRGRMAVSTPLLPRRREDQGSAFTLIELLVVVTIIVILLAMLTPAVDQAVYRGELTVCSTHQKGIATAATVYAAERQRK